MGSSKINSYDTPDFSANKGNVVHMREETWEAILSKKDSKLFTDIEKVDKEFPKSRTVSPGFPYESSK